MRYWVSWYEPAPGGDFRPRRWPLPAQVVEYWCTAKGPTMAILCAVVDAPDADAVKPIITSAGWSPHSWRTLEPKPPGWMPSDLPRATPSVGVETRPSGSERVCIAGGPNTGKTTLAASYGPNVRHTDDLITSHEWSEASDEVATWFDNEGPWCIEGVAVPRALRKWLRANAADMSRRPCDRVIWLTQPHIPLTKGQATMTKACATVWSEVVPHLRLRGVVIQDGSTHRAGHAAPPPARPPGSKR